MVTRYQVLWTQLIKDLRVGNTYRGRDCGKGKCITLIERLWEWQVDNTYETLWKWEVDNTYRETVEMASG